MVNKSSRKRHDIDFDRLRELLESGATGNKIMAELGIPRRPILEKAVFKLIQQDEKAYMLNWESRAKAKPKGEGRKVAVGVKGGVMISSSRLEKLGCDFAPKDKLDITWVDGKLIITRAS